ncbi:MAG TPA: hypothetical protein VI749_06595 [Candidatus Omnitrophota bacterium]|nr:hypothetical protein [Candidatus Omnitrophota bacterium]
MGTQELVLNIAVNLGRLCRWAMEGRASRIEQFLIETEEYIKALDTAPKSAKFQPTYERFKSDFQRLRQDVQRNTDWAEEMLTWANILTHRAKLA